MIIPRFNLKDAKFVRSDTKFFPQTFPSAKVGLGTIVADLEPYPDTGGSIPVVFV